MITFNENEKRLFDELAKDIFIKRIGAAGIMKFREAKPIADIAYIKAAAFIQARRDVLNKIVNPRVEDLKNLDISE